MNRVRTGPHTTMCHEASELVRDAQEAVEAVAKVGALDRAQVRQHAVDHFGLDRMTDQYLAACETVIHGGVRRVR